DHRGIRASESRAPAAVARGGAVFQDAAEHSPRRPGARRAHGGGARRDRLFRGRYRQSARRRRAWCGVTHPSMRPLAAVLAVSLIAASPALALDKATLPLVAMLRVNTPDTIEPMATMLREALAGLGQID